MVPRSCESFPPHPESYPISGSHQDRHFLELLVISEIHCLSHPIHALAPNNPTAERIHRHASRVRRVACERIGAERLHAYCERVKEAFDAYMHGGWGRYPPQSSIVTSEDGEIEEGDEGVDVEEDDGGSDSESDGSESGGEGSADSEERGRSKERGQGSVVRDEGPRDRSAEHSPVSPTAVHDQLAVIVDELSPVVGANGTADDVAMAYIDHDLDAKAATNEEEMSKIELEDVPESDSEEEDTVVE